MFGMTENDFQAAYDGIYTAVAHKMGLDPDLPQDECKRAIQHRDATAFALAELYRKAFADWWDEAKAYDRASAEGQRTDLAVERYRTQTKQRDAYRRSLEGYLEGQYVLVAH
jgi:hypothetical protein